MDSLFLRFTAVLLYYHIYTLYIIEGFTQRQSRVWHTLQSFQWKITWITNKSAYGSVRIHVNNSEVLLSSIGPMSPKHWAMKSRESYYEISRGKHLILPHTGFWHLVLIKGASGLWMIAPNKTLQLLLLLLSTKLHTGKGFYKCSYLLSTFIYQQ